MNPRTAPAPDEIKANWLSGLEGLRGWAASSIVVYHVAHLHGLQGGGLIGVVREYFGLGVPLFFIVSAFSLYHAHFDRPFTIASQRAFFVKRFFRIAPLFYLLLLYMNGRQLVLEGSIFPLRKIAGSVMFIFGLIPGFGEGIVWASWSIGIEMIFYLLFPIFLLFARSIRSAGFVLAVTTLLAVQHYRAVTASLVQPPFHALYNYVRFMPIFVAGILAFFVHRRLMVGDGMIRRRAAIAMLTAAALICVVLVGTVPLTFAEGGYRPAMSNFWLVMGFSFAFTLVVVAEATRPTALMTNAVSRGLGKTSYSLYLVHVILIQASVPLVAAIRTRFPMSDLADFFAISAATFVVLVPLCWATYRFVELPGMRLGSRVARRLLDRDALAA